MANTTTIRITHPETAAQMDNLTRVGSAKDYLARLQGYLDEVQSGSVAGNVTIDSQVGGTAGVQASGTLTLSGASGSVGGTIGGTTVTATASGGDTNSAALVAAAINANSTVNKWVIATSAAGVVTVKAINKGVIGNNVTLVASGTGVTASGAKLTAGAGDDVAPVTYSFA